MSTNIIKMTRGDSYEFGLQVEDAASESGYYKLIGNDAVYFVLMEPNSSFEDPLIAIKISADGTVLPAGRGSIDNETFEDRSIITIKLLEDDTTHLLPGLYYYTVKLNKDHIDPENANLSVKETITIINKTKFIILD